MTTPKQCAYCESHAEFATTGWVEMGWDSCYKTVLLCDAHRAELDAFDGEGEFHGSLCSWGEISPLVEYESENG